MTLQARVLNACAVAVLTAALGASVWFHGREAGKARIQLKWDNEKAAAAEETARLREEGFVIAADLELSLFNLRARTGAQDALLKSELARSVVCPAGGSVGDIVLSGGFIRGLFVTDASADEAAPAAGDVAGGVP